MGFLADLLGGRPFPSVNKAEVERIINDLCKIGQTEDFLSERPASGFNMQCRHIRARELGVRLDQIGGIRLLDYTLKKVSKRIGKDLGRHLSYAWTEIGGWVP